MGAPPLRLPCSTPLTDLVQLSGTATQAAFTENGLTNGIGFPAVNETDYADVLESGMQSNTQYTISVYVVRTDAAAVVAGNFQFRFSNTSIAMGSCALVSGALYRCRATATTPGSVIANANGVIRSGNAIGMRFSGFQINAGAALAAYTKTPYGQ